MYISDLHDEDLEIAIKVKTKVQLLTTYLLLEGASRKILGFLANLFVDYIQVNLCQNLLFLHQITHKYDNRLFIELQVQYMKIPSSNLGRTCCVQKLFLTFRTIFVHNMIFPCSSKRRASDKDLPVNLTAMYSILS